MRLLILSLLCIFGFNRPLAAETEETVQLTPEQQREVLSGLSEKLTNHYVYADRAQSISNSLESEFADGAYDAATTPMDFARAVSSDLVAVTDDQHFVVSYQPATNEDTLFETDDEAVARRGNFGFERLEVLPGNVGYVRFDYFPDPEPAYPLLQSAMRFVENTDALIIDLRYNNGGYLETAQYIASHLFDTEKDRALFRYFYNDDGETIHRSQWVLAAIPGLRRPDVPVYILTSSTSFSAAEWMAFSLQELKRATVVGQTTTGAAHPVERFRIDDDFVVQIPIGKIFGPVSGGDFQGSGVVPDYAVASHRALETAHRMALEQLAQNGSSTDAEWLLPHVAVESIDEAGIARDISAIQGSYEGRTFTLEDGTLMYRWRERYSLAIEPLGNGIFSVEGTEDYRFRLVYEKGEVSGVRREFRDGNAIFHRRID
ncbi:MAG: S41 family peptidase [Erythrobacter sp.]|nr:S41 family peptidase [Erythrobacter sp.]